MAQGGNVNVLFYTYITCMTQDPLFLIVLNSKKAGWLKNKTRHEIATALNFICTCIYIIVIKVTVSDITDIDRKSVIYIYILWTVRE